MNRIDRRKMLTGGAAALAVHTCFPLRAARRPNVILILTDDQGYGDLSCHGNPHLRTPNLDRLAAQSIAFTRFYVAPVCAPTRAGLLTGRDHLRTGVHSVTAGRETMRTEETTLAEALGRSGYRTGLFGKWHLGEHYPYVPHGQGFDEFIGLRLGNISNYFDARLERNGVPRQARGFVADYLTACAIGFVEQNRTRPFFLYLPYNTPHTPMQAPDRYAAHYRNLELAPETAAVYAMVANIDANVGRMLKRLDELSLNEETIVVFLCDNGPNTERYNCGLRARKGAVYEGGVRSPLFVRWPGHIPEGRKVETIAAHIDLLSHIA